MIRSLIDANPGTTPLTYELLTQDQIAVMCLSLDDIKRGGRFVKLSVSEAQNMGAVPPRQPGQLDSKVQRVRAAKAAKVEAAKLAAKADRRARRQRRREGKRR